MPNSVWHRLCDAITGASSDTVYSTPLSRDSFHVLGTEEGRVLIRYVDGEDAVSLDRENFETLFQRVQDARDGFDFDRLPPNAEPYATILSLLPQIEMDINEATIRTSAEPTTSPLIDPSDGESNDVTNETEAISSRDASKDETDLIARMMENMGDPGDRVTCPIDGCRYSHRSAGSVARHVSGSSTDTHIWANTSYSGWRDFVQRHG